MDEYLEQMLLTSPWGEGNGIIGKSWCGAGAMPMDSIGVELPKMATMHSGHLGLAFENEGLLGNHSKIPQQITDISNLSYPNMTMPNEGPANLTTDPGQGPPFSRLAGRFSPLSLLRANGFEGQGLDGMMEGLLVPTWTQPNYVGGVPSLPSALRKRCRDDDEDEEESVTGSGADNQSNPLSSINPPVHQSISTSGANRGVRAQVRAPRGQATDPHSIAERLRRERIAKRMKALQELVPDANKTDKASMLDEIIAYVRFLQMQVKCLSVCRLGGAGATAPIFSDLPSSEGMGNFSALAFNQSPGCSSQDGLERKVAGLMDEDMSAAMQYLQRKGLCLMPISLATAISTTTARPQTQSIPPPLSKGDESDNNFEPPHIMSSFGKGLVELPLHDNPAMSREGVSGISCSKEKGLDNDVGFRTIKEKA